MQTLYVYGDKESLHPCYTTYTRASDAKIPSCWGWWCLSWRCRG